MARLGYFTYCLFIVVCGSMLVLCIWFYCSKGSKKDKGDKRQHYTTHTDYRVPGSDPPGDDSVAASSPSRGANMMEAYSARYHNQNTPPYSSVSNHNNTHINNGNHAHDTHIRTSSSVINDASSMTSAAALPGYSSSVYSSSTSHSTTTSSSKHSTTTDATSPDGARSCVICLQNECGVVVVPCGHLCMCVDCSVHFTVNKDKCPMCREGISNMMKVY